METNIRKKCTVLVAAAAALIASSSFGATGTSTTKVRNVLLADGVGGGCMVAIRAMPANNVCGNAGGVGYVSFMCDGQNGVSKSDAQRRYDSAVLAMVTDSNINITITDEVLTEDGYCYAYDVRVNTN